jgi:hypothetical protein
MDESTNTKKGEGFLSYRRMIVFGAICLGTLAEIFCVLGYVRMLQLKDQDSFLLLCAAILVPMSWPWLRVGRWRRPGKFDSEEGTRETSSNTEKLLSTLVGSYMALLLTLSILLNHLRK